MKTVARDIMATELITVQEGASVETALKALISNRVTGLPVIDREQRMVGLVSEYDLIQQISSQPDLQSEIFQQPIAFTRDVLSVGLNTPLSEIVRHFVDARFRRVPVIDPQGKLVGIISRRDLMRLFYYRATLT